MGKSRILLVEGRSAGDNSLALAMIRVGLEVEVVHTGESAIAALRKTGVNVIVFDASSMRTSGVRTFQRLRRKAKFTPMIHCRTADVDRDESINAESFLVRPFTSRKLLNRVRTLIPADPNSHPIVRAGKITLYPKKRSVNVDGGKERRLTPKQARLLELLLRHPGEVLDRAFLMKEVWKTEYLGDTRTLDVHVRWLREHIEIDPAEPKLLITVRNTGYMLQLAPDQDRNSR
jgi:two-component system phosphate regulon response regulator PhoB